MSHRRVFTPLLRKWAKEFPAVAILGARQVGKSTLSRLAFPSYRVLDLESPTDFRRLKSDPAFVLGWVPVTLNATAAGPSLNDRWTAPAAHSTKDWIGLYEPGTPDHALLTRQNINAGSTGEVTINTPSRTGTYEVRIFLNDGLTRTATSNQLRTK